MSRLATVLDLESRPKLESTDYIELETQEGVGYIQQGESVLRHNEIYMRCCTLLLVLISLLCELLLLWRFLTFRNIVHHDEPHLALRPQRLEPTQTTVLNTQQDCIIIPKLSFA